MVLLVEIVVLVSLEVIVVGEGEEVARGRRLRLTCSVVIVPMMVCDDVHLVSRRLGSFMLRRNFLSLPLRLSPSRHPARSCDGWRPNNDGWRPINGGVVRSRWIWTFLGHLRNPRYRFMFVRNLPIQ